MIGSAARGLADGRRWCWHGVPLFVLSLLSYSDVIARIPDFYLSASALHWSLVIWHRCQVMKFR